jgi:hypothetical protein
MKVESKGAKKIGFKLANQAVVSLYGGRSRMVLAYSPCKVDG